MKKVNEILTMIAAMGALGGTGDVLRGAGSFAVPPKPTGRRRPGWHSPQRMERAAARRERKAAFRQRQYDGSLQR